MLPQEVMVDPVIAADGNTYERSAMEGWLMRYSTSPLTGNALQHQRLVPNVLIRKVIMASASTD